MAMSETIKIVIAGPRGKMGSEAVKMVTAREGFSLVGVIDVENDGKTLHEVDHDSPVSIALFLLI